MQPINRTGALACFAMAVGIVSAGAAVAIARYPGGFDWAYTVISRLASLQHNPAGGVWLAGALLPAMIVLWPATGYLKRSMDDAAGPVTALRIGIIGGALLGVEGLLQLDLSVVHRKGHEILALLTFGGLYGGVLGLYFRRVRQQSAFLAPALSVVLPLLAVCVTQFVLWFDQRDLGWVNTSWRELGVPLWLSFAFWQWSAVAMLWVGLGHLLSTRTETVCIAECATATTSNDAARDAAGLECNAASAIQH
jgi:hypothetical protein